VLLSPVLLLAFRRHPVVTVLAPPAFVAVDAVLGSPLADSGPVGEGVLDFVTFGACWMLGFAHREGMLRRIRPAVLAGLSAVAVGLGAWWTAGHPLPDGTFDLNEIPLGQPLISAAAILVFLRVSPGGPPSPAPPSRWPPEAGRCTARGRSREHLTILVVPVLSRLVRESAGNPGGVANMWSPRSPAP
jgi:hypothetical protein